jgi:HEAT repeat protein
VLFRSAQEDQGVVLCPDDKPVTARTPKEAIWNELTAMLKSTSTNDLKYAIGHLDQMSGGAEDFRSTPDFDRTEVLTAMRGLMAHRTPEIAQAAITVIGSRNPYLSDERALFWLATVGSAEVSGLSKMNPKMKNPGGERYQNDLIALADAKAAVATRALAIRALGLVREPSLREPINRWLKDSEPAVRASAALLLADFPGPDMIRQLTALVGDPAPGVRAAAARATGFAQQTELAQLLGRLLGDRVEAVREAAAQSLLSFSPKTDSVAEVFRAQLDNKEFQPLFLNALAREKPEAYLDGLARVIKEKTEPAHFPGGTIPAFTAWQIL